jgi:hypothetical protein
MQTNPTTALKARHGGYQVPICLDISEKINGTVAKAPINPIAQIAVIIPGLLFVMVAASLAKHALRVG